MKNRKAAGAAALAVVLSILLTACASSPGTSGKLEIDPEQTAQADSAADSSATGQTEEQTAQPETEQAGSGKSRIPGRAAQATVRAGTVFSLEAANINIRKQTMR